MSRPDSWVRAAALVTPDAEDVGGKARNLSLLQASGARVPPWVVLTVDALDARIGETFLTTRDRAGARRRIRETPLPLPVLDALQRLLSAPGLAGQALAVRSSAAVEDGADLAWAGLFHSVLNVRSGGVQEAIRAVHASAWSDEAFAYADAHGIEDYRPRMAVVIQALVKPTVSAVAFGAHPVTGERDVCVVNATWGLGEGVVGGVLPTDSWTVRRGAVEPRIASKTAGWFANDDGTLEQRPIAEDRQGVPCLDDARLREIAALVHRLGETLGAPQDVELALVDDTVLVLQARPITNLPEAPGPPTVWDNNNLIDNYPGLTVPLTVSFVQRTYHAGNRQLADLIGVPRATIEAHDALFAAMVGAVRGRLYYNLSHIRGLLSLLPLSGLAIRYYDEAIGARSDEGPPVAFRVADGPALLRTAWALTRGFWTLGRERQALLVWIEPKVSELEAMDPAPLSAGQVFRAYRTLEDQVFGRWRAPSLNGFLAMLALGTLRRLAGRWGVEEERANLVNELVASGDHSVSKAIVDEVVRLAALVRERPSRQALFQDHDDESLNDAIGSSGDAELQSGIEAYLQRYGDRSVGGELKLETPSYRQRPALLYRAIRSHLDHDGTADAPAPEGPDAEALLEHALSGHPLRKRVFRTLLRWTRDLVRWREDFRFLRTRMVARARGVYHVIGDKLASQGLLETADDILWLEVPEVAALVDDALPPEIARLRVRERRQRYRLWEGEQLPERIVWAGDPDRYVPPAPPDLQPGDQLSGIGCSPGVVQGRARVVSSAADLGDLGGDILVAVSTDTGWVQYFPTASAIVVERGSLLSHIAIVTRELGIPAAIGVRDATSAIRTGDRIRMDGSTGAVQVIERHVPHDVAGP